MDLSAGGPTPKKHWIDPDARQKMIKNMRIFDTVGMRVSPARDDRNIV
jgi:hypothetical protein